MASPDKKVPAHPKVSVMVDEAIKTLAMPKGSSMHAINKYISANYDVDVKKLSFYIKRYLKAAVESGDMVQPTGKGASGSFKINKKKVEAKPKAAKVKSVKSLKVSATSTPNKPKIVPTKSPNKSPVKKMKSTDDEEKPADSTFTMPKTKITKKPKISLPTKPRKSKGLIPTKAKKPKKLMAKNKPQFSASPKMKPKKTITSPKIVKAKGEAKSKKAQKSPKPKKPAASKKAASKGAPTKDEQE